MHDSLPNDVQSFRQLTIVKRQIIHISRQLDKRRDILTLMRQRRSLYHNLLIYEFIFIDNGMKHTTVIVLK